MPKGLPWFRLYSEFAFDPKIQTMSETLQRRYIMLLCLKCNGDLPGLNDIQLSCALRISVDELKITHKTFLEIGIITDNYDIPKWSERQYISDSSTLRVKKFRNKKGETLQKRYRNGNVTAPSVSVSVSKSVSKSLIPTMEELKSYIQEKKYNIDPEKFFAYYESNGWMVGKNKMKSWKAALVTWNKSDYNSKPKQSSSWGGIQQGVTLVHDNCKNAKEKLIKNIEFLESHGEELDVQAKGNLDRWRKELKELENDTTINDDEDEKNK